MNIITLSIGSLVLCLAVLLCACSGGDNTSNDPAQVDELSFDEETIGLTDQINLDVKISYSPESVFDADQSVVVLLRISGGLSYVPDSAHVRRDGVDPEIPVDLEDRCANGDTFLSFNLDRTDLNSSHNRQPDSATLVLTLQAIRLGPAVLEARAQYNQVAGSCAAGIVPDAATSIKVVVNEK
jgi:hypothetical protein